ncbi:MAG: DMT family transporter [Ignavibacteriales bacterium]|nr:DMT family transporter [Ignavibacteriales bacterium]
MTSLLSIRVLLIFCVTIWGWTFVAMKICLAAISPMELIGLRFLLGLPILYAIIVAKKIPFTFSKEDVKPIAIGAIIIATHFIVQAVGLQFTTATNSSWIIAVTPLAMALLSCLILKEKLGGKEIIGIGISTFGISLLVFNGDIKNFGGMKSVGDWIVLFTAHTWALFTIATRDISRKHHPLVVTFMLFLPMTITCLMYVAFTSNVSKLYSLETETIFALLFLGTLGTITQWIWQEGIAKLGAARAGIFMYLEPIATTVIAIPLLGEKFTTYIALGGTLVLAGVWNAQRNSKQN